jgi:hypothetical protein
MNKLIAYNIDNLDAQLIREQANIWQKKGWINSAFFDKIKAHFLVDFYSPNIFMRVGAFIFCTILVWASFALITQFESSYSEDALSSKALFMGIICIAILEFMIKSKHYKSGIDDALLYNSLIFLTWGISNFLKLDPGQLAFYWIFLPILTLATIRYTDTLITAVTYGCALTIVVLTTMKFPTIAPSVLSFVVTFFAIIMYFSSVKLQKNVASRFWKPNLDVVEGLSLILFYASCNYYVLQQANETYFNNPTVALAPLFWFLTFAIPVFYIYQGLKQKNRLILSMGLLGIAAGVATFRYYFHIVPMEIAAIVAGAILLAFAYFSIQYLKRHQTPYTYEEDGEKPFYQQAESLIIAQSLGGATPQEGEKPLFGGGDFGGGGAGENF